MVRQMSEEHDNKVCQTDYEQLPNRWNNSWLHIPLAHETHEVHERKSTERVMKRYSVDLRPEIFASFRVFRGPILLMRWYSSHRSKKTKDSRLVFLSRCAMQIDVPSVTHEPHFF